MDENFDGDRRARPRISPVFHLDYFTWTDFVLDILVERIIHPEKEPSR